MVFFIMIPTHYPKFAMIGAWALLLSWGCSESQSLSVGVGVGFTRADGKAVPKTLLWPSRFHAILNLKNKDSYDTIVIGDSITMLWGGLHTANTPELVSPESWQRTFGAHALNLGFGSDSTESTIWRINHGELNGFHPKKVYVFIGTNDLGNEQRSAMDTALGIEEVCVLAKAKTGAIPTVIGVLPRFPKPGRKEPKPGAVAEVDTTISKWCHAHGYGFIQWSLKPSELRDGLHPTPQGYEALSRKSTSWFHHCRM